MSVICQGCGDEVDEGDAINFYCYSCVDKHANRPVADTLAQESAMRLCESIGQQGYKGSSCFVTSDYHTGNITNDPNLGHKWRMNGDVSQCRKCKTYLGLWDGKQPCKA